MTLTYHGDVRSRIGPCHGCSQVKGCTHVMALILPIKRFFLEEFMSVDLELGEIHLYQFIYELVYGREID